MMRVFLLGLMLAAVSLAGGLVQAAAAETASVFSPAQRAEVVAILRDALKTDPTILRDAILALQSQDRVGQEAAARSAIQTLGPALTHEAADPVAGNPAGDVSVVEFYDLRCPYCRRMLPVMAELLKRDPSVRLVFKDIPILGPGSVLGARAVLAAQKQDGYLKLRDAIMTGPADITPDSLQQAAARAGLDWERLQHDMTDPSIKVRIDANLALAHKLEISGTPAYVIGTEMLPGAVELADLQAVVKQARAR